MLKLYFFVFFIFFIINFSIASEKINKNQCSWVNDPIKPCIKIIKNINNTSKFTKYSINKYIITKEEIDKIGAIDLVDVLKTINFRKIDIKVICIEIVNYEFYSKKIKVNKNSYR